METQVSEYAHDTPSSRESSPTPHATTRPASSSEAAAAAAGAAAPHLPPPLAPLASRKRPRSLLLRQRRPQQLVASLSRRSVNPTPRPLHLPKRSYFSQRDFSFRVPRGPARGVVDPLQGVHGPNMPFKEPGTGAQARLGSEC